MLLRPYTPYITPHSLPNPILLLLSHLPCPHVAVGSGADSLSPCVTCKYFCCQYTVVITAPVVLRPILTSAGLIIVGGWVLKERGPRSSSWPGHHFGLKSPSEQLTSGLIQEPGFRHLFSDVFKIIFIDI